MIILIVILLLIIALPSILNILGITWFISKILSYKYYLLTITFSIIAIYFYINKNKFKWYYFSKKTERIVSRTIEHEFYKNPSIASREVFDLIVKQWVPISNKLYPHISPKDLGIRLKVTPKGIEDRINDLS